MSDVTINITVDSNGKTDVNQSGIKNIVKKKKLGTETVLQMPQETEDPNRPKNILDMLGL